MLIQPHVFTPKASFDEPVSLLLACHERLRHFVALLEKLADYVPQHGVDQQAKGTISALIRYFEMAAPLHHADEDEDLFPTLHAHCHHERLNDTLVTLSVAHVHLEFLWQALKHQMIDLTEGKRKLLDKEMATVFAAQYRQHVQQEEEEVYPFVHHLSAKYLSLLGQRMQARRGG